MKPTYLVIRTRRGDWALGGDFTMIAATTRPEAYHLYDGLKVQDGLEYARQSGTTYRLIEVKGQDLRTMEQYTP